MNYKELISKMAALSVKSPSPEETEALCGIHSVMLHSFAGRIDKMLNKGYDRNDLVSLLGKCERSLALIREFAKIERDECILKDIQTIAKDFTHTSFGDSVANTTPDSGMSVEQIARVCHNVNASYCAAIGDTSQLNWEHAPEWQRESAIKGVQFHIDNPTAGPSASHNNWMKQKEDEGWVYGQEKNSEARTHPCIVPYESLPVAQQAKDYIFTTIVHGLKP